MLIGAHRVCLARRTLVFAVALLTAWAWSSLAVAQDENEPPGAVQFRDVQVFNIVGGVSINADKLLTNADRDSIARLCQIRRDAMEPIPDAMNKTSGLRKVSLRKLEAAIKDNLDHRKPLPDAVGLLAGLQQIRYVLVYPEQKDIVLVGPAEGWRLDSRGCYVGVNSGRPVMLLDDLLVALRSAAARPSVMSCSINPTPEGVGRVRALAQQVGVGADARVVAAGVQDQLGPQKITVQGVPETSHFARVMVGADYRMKRIGIALEPSPVRSLPSYVDMIRGGSGGNASMTPRWWLQPDYQPLLRDDEGLAWELRGASVRCMTETDFLDASGVARPTGRSDAASQRWADLMTSHYEELAVVDPVFGQLRNCMDLAVVAALVAKERLTDKAGESFPLLTGTSGRLGTVKLDAPKQVAPGASLARKGKRTMVAAGGVQINPWSAVDKIESTAALAQVRGKASNAAPGTWWWD